MREIKCRGRREDNGEWVYGYYVRSSGHLIHEGDYGSIWVVIPETVGQYTGLKDKSGKEIYEGDKLKCSIGTIIVAYPFLELWSKKLYGEEFEVIGNKYEEEK